jgi:TetR/AcrR family transcriptional repressor of lmrAB and yxaGH operons
MTTVIISYDDRHSNEIYMKHDARDEMVEGALLLLAKHGLQATSFSEVLALTKAPRGSIYHHFPRGKEQLIAEALKLSEIRTTQAIKNLASRNPELITLGFMEMWRQLLISSAFTAGCSAVAVTVATDSQELLIRAASIFLSWQDALSELLIESGVMKDSAKRFASLLIAASEGAVVMARSQRNLDPFESVAKSLVDQANQLANHEKQTTR